MMLKANKDNSKVIPKLSSIELTGLDGFIISSLNFKHIVMANFNALENNKWFLYWFKTQAVTIGNKESTIILKMCQVGKGGTFPFILKVLYLL